MIPRKPLLLALGLAPALSGCISLKTPDKPIEINLSVAIRQEVVVRMQRDVEQLINQNPEAFPSRSGTTGTPAAPTTTPAPKPRQ